jgi:hypothetical protein
MRKNNYVQRPADGSNGRLEHLMHAVAFVILQRQMRGKWTSRIQPSSPL